MTNLDKLSTLGSLGRWDSTGLTKYALTVSESRGKGLRYSGTARQDIDVDGGYRLRYLLLVRL